MVNYRGSIVNLLFSAVENNPNMTIGEIIYSFTNKKQIGKHYVEATDEELYTSLERFTESIDEQDEPFDEQGWDFWCQKQIIK